MLKDIHFISGLPRSGSSLLASILRQNPRYHSHIESPIGQVISDAHTAMGPRNEMHVLLKDIERARVLIGIFEGYYSAFPQEVIFDNNRRWCAHVDLLMALFPECRVLACVRSIPAIVDSLEQIVREFPLSLSVIEHSHSNTTVYDRVGFYMAPNGLVGYAYNALKTALYSDHKDHVILVRYDDLARYPGDVMNALHDVLGEDRFNYDFKHIEQIPDVDVFDRSIGTPGLHRLGKRVEYRSRVSLLPPDIIRTLPPDFWDVQKPVTKSE